MNGMDWNRLLGLDHQDREKLRHTGYGYLKGGNYQAALIYFEGLSLIERGNLFDLQALGCIHLQMGKGSEAIFYFDRALEVDPADLRTQLNRAKALFAVGDCDRALEIARELAKSSDEMIASLAEALVMAHTERG